MNKRILIVIWSLVQVLAITAQQTGTNTGTNTGNDNIAVVGTATFDLYPVLNPWLGTTNPAGMRFNPGVSIGDLSLNFEGVNRDYRRAQEGDSLRNYFLRTSSFKKIKNTWVFGNFSYEKSFERNCNYNLVNNPYRNTPYLLVDTMGRNDIYDREFFNLRGDISTPFGDAFSWGMSVNMDVGLSSQDRDPRPRNKVMNLDVAQGLLFTKPGISLGINMLYSYYNEDIEIDIIEENLQLAFFQLHGFDTYTYHVASSFNRLYQRTSLGGEGQLGLQLGGLNTVVGAKFVYLDETADDGRKAGNASWSYIKNDSEMLGNLLRIFNVSTFSHGKYHHQFDAGYTLRYMLGAEILQRLEQVGEAGAVDWVDYGKEEKYGATYSDIGFNYTFLAMKDHYLPGLALKLGVALNEMEQEYRLPDMHESRSSRKLSGSAKKTFYAGANEISVGVGAVSRKHLSGRLDLEGENAITELLVRPDFEYYSQSSTGLWASLSYGRQMGRLFEKFFAGMHVSSLQAENGTKQQQINISTGLIF